MNKELDALLIEVQDKDGYTLKFTLRGDNVQELKKKLDEIKALWFEDIKPVTQASNTRLYYKRSTYYAGW